MKADDDSVFDGSSVNTGRPTSRQFKDIISCSITKKSQSGVRPSKILKFASKFTDIGNNKFEP